MERLAIAPRSDWREKVEGCGLIWHTGPEANYWDESACYAFDARDVRRIEDASRELYAMFLRAGDHVIDNGLLGRFGVPDWCEPLIAEAWAAEPPALNYGRFDLGYDGQGPPKLFEFNCDTPTSLLEAAVVQWQWKEDCFPGADQFNDLHEALVAKWRDIAPHLQGDLVHFAHAADASGEDAVTTAYLLDTAQQAGLTAEALLMNDIGWASGRFWDVQNREIRTLYHLYPWEWIVNEPFGRHLMDNQDRTRWIEPVWKMMWSNKAILPILWELNPGHPNLLWATAGEPKSGSFVRKPTLGREGANITLIDEGGQAAATGGPYDGGAFICQELYRLPDYDGRRPVLGSWIVDGEPAGLGVREGGAITGNLAGFKPHIVR